MKIWDLHCHLSGVTGATPGERMGQLLAIADRMGIERLCVYMGMKWSQDPSPETLRKENDEVLEAIGKFPDRTFGFVYLNPKHLETSLAELERCVAKGPMVGVKLWVAQHCNVPELDPIIHRAAELKAVIFSTPGLRLARTTPENRRRTILPNSRRGIPPCRSSAATPAATGSGASAPSVI
jgi:predicted TIM-barrel fold metal-dependent hydrolase